MPVHGDYGLRTGHCSCGKVARSVQNIKGSEGVQQQQFLKWRIVLLAVVSPRCRSTKLLGVHQIFCF